MRILFAILFTFSQTSFAEKTLFSTFDDCAKLENKNKLLHQRFSKSKKCVNSKTVKGSIDCSFSAQGTTLKIVGATKGSLKSRMYGVSGTGYYISSVDKNHKVRPVLHENGNLIIRVDKSNFKNCVYDTAYILLNSEVKYSL